MTTQPLLIDAIKERIAEEVANLLSSLSSLEALSIVGKREIIARYAAVLEGNFIPWMTAAHIAAQTNEARQITKENLTEEIRDNHPGMMRQFALGANAAPTNTHYALVYSGVQEVRSFISTLSSVRIFVMMAFFENFIAVFMPYLADLAKAQGSQELTYTDVHGVLDIAHTEGLYKALEWELNVSSGLGVDDIYDGMNKLVQLIRTIVNGSSSV